ncbi:MAG: BolA family protein [Myxococcota bacterium]
MFEATEIKRLIETALPGSVAVVVDEANDGEHFVAEVMSPSFAGQSLVKQHQAVYGALGGHMGGAIHALALKTYTPDQWAKRK